MRASNSSCTNESISSFLPGCSCLPICMDLMYFEPLSSRIITVLPGVFILLLYTGFLLNLIPLSSLTNNSSFPLGTIHRCILIGLLNYRAFFATAPLAVFQFHRHVRAQFWNSDVLTGNQTHAWQLMKII